MATPTTLPASFVSGAVLTASQMNNLRGAFRVLQVVSTTKTDTYSTTSTTFADITGLTATITPSSTSSKILVVVALQGGANQSVTSGQLRLRRGSTDIAIADAASSRPQLTAMLALVNEFIMGTITMITLDSPATTSATTYAVHLASQVSGQVVGINRTADDGATRARATSSITVMEISA